MNALRNSICFIVTLLISLTALGASSDSLTVKIISGFGNKELQQLAGFQGIEQTRIQFGAARLKGCEFQLYFEAYDSGKVTEKGRLTSGLPATFYHASSDTFELKCLSKSEGDSVKINFYFPRFNTSTIFTLDAAADQYSMRVALPTNTDQPIRFPADSSRQAVLVYSLPYKRPDMPGSSFYCELSREGIPPALWWEKFKVPHYIVFYVRASKSMIKG